RVSSSLVSGARTMTCGGLSTHALSAVGPVANGSVLLVPLSPRSMYATPTPLTLGSVFDIHAAAQPCHSLSRHMVSLSATMHIQPLVPAFTSRILPPSSIT